MTSTVHATGRASPFVLTYVAEILPLSESLELKICAIHLHSSLRAMNGVFSRGTDKIWRLKKTGWGVGLSTRLKSSGLRKSAHNSAALIRYSSFMSSRKQIDWTDAAKIDAVIEELRRAPEGLSAH